MCPNLPSPESAESGVGSPISEWMLVGVIGSHELGTPERVMQLEKMKQRKTDHGETVVTYFRSWHYKYWLSKTLTFSLLPTSTSPIQEGLVPIRLLLFSPTGTPISPTYNCSVPFCLLMQNVTQTMWNSWNKLYKFKSTRDCTKLNITPQDAK